VHVILDLVLVSFLVVDWDDRAVVAEVRLHLVDIDLGEICGKILNTGSCSRLLGSTCSSSSTRRSLVSRHVGSSVFFEVLKFVFVNPGVFGT
jgi:hypothetical protein